MLLTCGNFRAQIPVIAKPGDVDQDLATMLTLFQLAVSFLHASYMPLDPLFHFFVLDPSPASQASSRVATPLGCCHIST